MTVDTVIVDSHVVLPEGMIDRNIIINDGHILRLGTDVPACEHKINGAGLVSVPGPIDPHVHYGVYSPIGEAAKSESHAAAIGGVTTMMRMMRLSGRFDVSLLPQLEASQNNHYVDYTAHASVFTESQVDTMAYCKKNGIASFKIYMNLGGEVGHVYMDMPPDSTDLQETQVNMTDDMVRRIVQRAAELHCPVLVHAEDYESCACGIKEAKEANSDGLVAWSNSRSPEYEAMAIHKVCSYARQYDCTIYFVHIGSQTAFSQIDIERQLGTRIFVESCPHYMVLTCEGKSDYLAKVMPPIRTSKDVQAVWESLANGKIDTIGTDHVANQLSLKVGSDVWGSLAGFPSIGVAIPLLLSEGVNRNRMGLEQFVNVTSTNTAKIFSMYPRKGTLRSGADADIAMLDLRRKRKVESAIFGGFSDYSIYEGMNLQGWPAYTIVRGNVIAEDLEVIGKPGYGRFVFQSP